MDRDQLIDLTRRALKLARDKKTDLTPAEHTVAADTYTSAQRHAEDKSMLLTSPQLVGYSSELPRPGTYCTKTVMGRSILLTRSADNTVRAFDNVCLHRQSRIADGGGAARRLACPYHAWTYDLDGNLVGIPGKEGFPETRSGAAKLTELPAAECAGFLWISLDRETTRDIPAFLGPLSDELESWGLGAGRRWVRRCSTARSIGSSPSIRSPRTTISRRYTRQRSRQSRAATAPSSIPSARTTDLSFPSTEFSVSRTFLFSSGIRCTTWWSSMRCSRTSCCRARSPMGNCSVSIPPTSRAGRSPCTRTQPRWICPTSRWPPARRRSSTMRMPRSATRITHWWRDCRPTWSRVRGSIWCSVATNLGCSTATKRGKRRSAVDRELCTRLGDVFEHEGAFGGACGRQDVGQLPVPVERQRSLIEREAAHRVSAKCPAVPKGALHVLQRQRMRRRGDQRLPNQVQVGLARRP